MIKIGNRYTKITVGVLIVLWMLVIFYMSSQPANQSDKASNSIVYLIERFLGLEKDSYLNDLLVTIVRKGAHVSEYAVLGALTLCFAFHFDKKTKMQTVCSFLFCVFYAATDEIHQLFVEGRAGRFTDVCIDSAGVIVGICVCYVIVRFVKKRA